MFIVRFDLKYEQYEKVRDIKRKHQTLLINQSINNKVIIDLRIELKHLVG